VVACKAPDGSYWAVQEWQRELPDYGVAPTKAEAAWEIRLSHWTGPLAKLTVDTDWAWHQWDHLFGTLSYLGRPAYGFHSTSVGNPGAFCYSFNPHADHPAGNGSRYRVTVISPGVTPDLSWQSASPGPYDATADAKANDEIAALHDSQCRAN